MPSRDFNINPSANYMSVNSLQNYDSGTAAYNNTGGPPSLTGVSTPQPHSRQSSSDIGFYFTGGGVGGNNLAGRNALCCCGAA